jgi:hypothetical protein
VNLVILIGVLNAPTGRFLAQLAQAADDIEDQAGVQALRNRLQFWGRGERLKASSGFGILPSHQLTLTSQALR